MKLNIKKKKSIVFGTGHSLNVKPCLDLLLNYVALEQVEETKLLAVTLDSKLSWSKHIDSMVAKMGRGLSMIGRCSVFLTSQSTRHVLQALVLLHLDYCPAVWSCAAKKDIGQFQLVQNKAARITLRCTRSECASNMHVSLSWFKVEEKLTASLLVFV
jgi:hypothetical protein